MRIEIKKKQRTITCFTQNKAIFSSHIWLGFGADDGAKAREGDGRTPEGNYRVSAKNPRSKFCLSLGLSYPNADDAERGLYAGIISRADYDRIITSPGRPPWDTPLGGFIMIHGEPKDGTRTGDWTAGCIALQNAEMEILYTLTRIGDEVVIYP